MRGSVGQADRRQNRNRLWTKPLLRLSLLSPLGFVLSMCVAAVALGSGVVLRVSTDSVGVQAYVYSPVYNNYVTSVSADGRYVAFESYADNLVPGDNGFQDIFVKDAQTGVTTRISTDSSGNQANSDSYEPSISADGRYVAFESYADNLVPGDNMWNRDIFLKDSQTGITIRISTDSNGNQADGFSARPSISADGRYVAFESYASNLVAGDTNSTGDVFLKDTQTGAITRVSTSATGSEGNSWSAYSAISADGRYVAFESYASNLVAGDTNSTGDVFLKDTQTGAITRVSTDSAGNQGNGSSHFASISADGRYVAFSSDATNFIGGDTNGFTDVFIKDTQIGTITRVSTDSLASEGNGYSSGPSISVSADGRYVAFSSMASNLVAGDTNYFVDIFMKDTQTGATTRVSTDASGNQANSHSYEFSISADGHYVALSSSASNLVAGDTNTAQDSFLAETSITCTAGKPDLALQKDSAYWGSMADYTAELLSIDYKVKNNGAAAAYIVQVTGAVSSNGVTCPGCSASLGNLIAGYENDFTFRYSIPTGVTSFSTTVTASAQDGCGTVYTYP